MKTLLIDLFYKKTPFTENYVYRKSVPQNRFQGVKI